MCLRSFSLAKWLDYVVAKIIETPYQTFDDSLSQYIKKYSSFRAFPLHNNIDLGAIYINQYLPIFQHTIKSPTQDGV